MTYMSVTVFYASGAKGKSIRADGYGGTLPRGWYAKTFGGYRRIGRTFGPFPTKTAANLKAFGTVRET